MSSANCNIKFIRILFLLSLVLVFHIFKLSHYLHTITNNHYDHSDEDHVSSSQKKIIPLNSNHGNYTSSIQSDIINITHYPNEATVVIYLQTNIHTRTRMNNKNDRGSYQSINQKERQCYTPNVRGRLSGPVISIIQWTEYQSLHTITTNDITYEYNNNHNNSNKSNNLTEIIKITEKLIGTYTTPTAGRYYIEIVGLSCNHNFDDKEYNFKKECLVDPLYHRLTSNEAFIDVVTVQQQSIETEAIGAPYTTIISTKRKNNDDNFNSSSFAPSTTDNKIGYWKWNDTILRVQDVSTSNSSSISRLYSQFLLSSSSPLYTRFQPQNCRYGDKDTPRCALPSNISRFYPYQYEFTTKIQSQIDTTLQLYKYDNTFSTTNNSSTPTLLQVPKKTICIIGWSHTRRMISSIQQIFHSYNISSHKLETQWIKAKFPNELHDIQFMYNMHNQYKQFSDNNCTHVLVGVGQWPGSIPILLRQFENDMEEAVKVMLKAKDEMGFELILRSIQ